MSRDNETMILFECYYNMLIRLFDKDGKLKAELSPDDSSVQEKEVQGDNLLKLSFVLYKFVGIDVNDYVDYGGERYWAVEKYAPAEKSTVEWEYSFQLYGVESLIKRFLVLNNTDGENEAVFTLTARPIDHVRLIVKNINAGMEGIADFKSGTVEGTDNVTIEYTGKYCQEALKELAEAVGTEWWIEGETVNLSRCEHGEEITLGYDKGLTALDRDMADGAKFYTRLFPIGSSRNIDAAKYGHSRLMLPGGVKYVDVNVENYGVIHHYEQKAFAEIYPRRIGVVSSVRSKEVKDKEGKFFTIYYFKDEGLTFDPNTYEIGGLVKRVSFQEGSELAGLGTSDDHYFEVNFDSDTKEFEIITIWPYDEETQLPGGTLIPKEGDKYILWNIRMPDEYYGLAEREFRTAVDEYNRKHALDVSRYKAPTDHVWMEETSTELLIGSRIRLESREYFPIGGYRSSRITKISRKVNLPSQMDIEISDALSKGAMTKIDDAISDAKNYAGTLVGSINVPDIIRCGDKTKPTDNNLYSARRTNKEFLSKLYNDIVNGNITFRQAIYVLGVSAFKGGAQFGEFVKSMYDGKGAGIDEHGNAEFESVRVRTYFEAVELIINRLSAIEGDQVLTESDTIDSVDNLGNSCYGLHLHPKWEGYFTAISPGSVLKGIVNNLGAVALGMSGQGGLKEYTSWMRVNSVNAAGNYIEVTVYPDEDTPARRNFPPCELMKVARWGHQTDEKRQSCIYLSSTEGRIVKLTGVTKPIIDRTNYGAVFGTLPEFVKTLTDNEGNPLPLREGFDYMYIPGIVTQDIVRIDWQGRPVVNYVDCGQWIAGKNYFCEALNPDSGIYETNDVWHIGCKYRCMKNLTKAAPAWNTPDWVMIEGNPAFGVEFEDTDTLFDPDKFDVTLKIIAKMFNQDVTDDILDADVQWTRYSEDANGVERVASDNAWAIRRTGAGKAMHLTLDDIDMLGYMPRVTRFTATVTLRDGMGKAAKKGVAIFEN